MTSSPPPFPPGGPPGGGPGGAPGGPPGAGPAILGPGGIQFPPGQRPTPEQIQAVQRKIAEDAQKAGMSVPEFIETIKKQAQERAIHMRKLQAQQQQGGPPGPHNHPGAPAQVRGPQPAGGVRQPITPGPPKPQALAIAKFLRGQNLKPRTCILNGERKDMFKGIYAAKYYGPEISRLTPLL